MEKFNLLDDIKVFGIQVTTFPDRIGETFDSLAKSIIDNGFSRPYYGISWMDDTGKVIYYAVTAEISPGESAKYAYEIMTIVKGEYLALPVKDWMSKTAELKDIFHEMMQDKRTDKTKPCIEWYKSDDEMLCMMKTI